MEAEAEGKLVVDESGAEEAAADEAAAAEVEAAAKAVAAAALFSHDHTNGLLLLIQILLPAGPHRLIKGTITRAPFIPLFLLTVVHLFSQIFHHHFSFHFVYRVPRSLE